MDHVVRRYHHLVYDCVVRRHGVRMTKLNDPRFAARAKRSNDDGHKHAGDESRLRSGADGTVRCLTADQARALGYNVSAAYQEPNGTPERPRFRGNTSSVRGGKIAARAKKGGGR